MNVDINHSLSLPSFKQITKTLKDESFSLGTHLGIGAFLGAAYALSEYFLFKHSFSKSIYTLPYFLAGGVTTYADHRITPYVFKQISPYLKIRTTKMHSNKEIAAYLATSISVQAIVFGLLIT